MSSMTKFFGSSLGAKVIMAVTGAALVGFVVAHMAANLLVFTGPDGLNGYAHKLEGLGPLLWVARIGLLVFAVAHIVSAIRLVQHNQAARPQGYAVLTPQDSTIFSRYMKVTGMIVLTFLLYHLAHFTFGMTDPQHFKGSIPLYDLHGEMVKDVNAMVIHGFRNPMVAGFYILANILLGFHLTHGVWSMFQSLGLRTPSWAPLLKNIARGVGLAVVAGNVLIPLSIALGWIGSEVPLG